MGEKSQRVDWSSLRSADWKTNPPVLELKYPDGKIKYTLAVPYHLNGKNEWPDINLNLYFVKNGVVLCIPLISLKDLQQKGEITCLENNESVGVEFVGFVNDLRQNEIWPALQAQTPLDRIPSLV